VPAVIPAGAQPRKKQVRDQGEQDLYNQAIHAGDAAEQIQALGAWTARYPDSDFKDDRLYFYMQAYARATPPEPAKVVEYGSGLIGRDLRTLFPGSEGGLVMLNVWFLVCGGDRITRSFGRAARVRTEGGAGSSAVSAGLQAAEYQRG